MITETHIQAAADQLFEGLTFPDTPSGLYDPLRYTMSIGGKRLRPRLCLTTYSLYKDTFDEGILSPAAALEVFHNFTLIHDDIMDRSPLRRKMPTVWKKWNADTAILSGDVMCIDSYARLAKAPSAVLPEVLALFSRTAAEVCEGQQYDMEFETRETVPMEAYMQMIGLKTGVLLACAAEMGARIALAPAADCKQLYQYGFHLGLAFQVADDYLDAYGDEKVFGKPIGGDIVNNKKSWLTVRAMEKADAAQQAELRAALSAPSRTQEERSAKIARVKECYNALSIDEDAKYEILRLNEEALRYASCACTGVRLEVLRRFADKLVGRTF